MPKHGTAWSKEELLAAVKAYMEMLNEELARRSYTKSAYNTALRQTGGPLEGRSKSSVEYRMQNISAALDAAGLPYIEGYKPAKNVGSRVINELQDIIMSGSPELLQPTQDAEKLERRVKVAQRLVYKQKERPVGQQTPLSGQSSRTTFSRCPRVKAWILEHASGKCEGCGADAPFHTKDGQPFLEVHHLQPLSNGGPDTVENAAALCPNCHRRCHYSADANAFTNAIRANLSRP